MFRPVAVVPVYDHDGPVATLVAKLVAQQLPCLLVDDGSSPRCAAALDSLVERFPGSVTLVRHAVNQGKGGAVLTGLAQAAEAGYTHALQIDADGQHDVTDAPAFIADAARTPSAFIAGQPVFDASVPRGRLYPRYLTHFMVAINTLHAALRDSMCGFRVYPIAAVLQIAAAVPLGRRMDFDTDVFVRLSWAGVPFVLRPTKVRYPEDGVSHFQLWHDNVLITRMHTLLFFGMLRRFPGWLIRGRWPT